MLRLFRKKIPGGLAFGPPAWMPERIENTFDKAQPPNHLVLDAAGRHGGTKLNNRPALVTLLRQINLARASQVLPGLAEQLAELGERPLRAMALVLLPTQPEFVLGAALSSLAMQDVYAGLDAIQICAGPKKSLIIMDRHDFATRRSWKGPAAELKASRVGMLNQYPRAHPTLLARALFGQTLPVDALPSTLNLLLIDPVSCWALGRYLRTGQVFTDRPVQLFTQNAPPRLLIGRIGEPLSEFLARYRVEANANSQMIVNGMLTGRQAPPLHAASPAPPVVTAMIESISVREPVGNEPPTPCIACGWCVDVCPTALTPVHLMELNQKPASEGLLRSKDAREAVHCISCGLCSYVCPTRLPLMEQTLQLRGRVMAEGGK